MKTGIFRARQAVALGIGLLGLYVLLGWMLGSSAMVRVVPNSVAMGLNSSVLFIAAALCLQPAPWPEKFSWIPVFCGWLLLFLPALILYEHVGDIDLGIDWASLHATVQDGNPRPGRVAPNTCVGFICAGLALLLLRRPCLGRANRCVAVGLTMAVMIIGLTALLGYALGLESMYRLAQYNRMATPTALGMSLVAVGLWLSQRQKSLQCGTISVNLEQDITRLAALVLTVLVLVTGFVGFVVLKQGFDESMAESMLRSVRNDATYFASTLEQRLQSVGNIATRPGLQRYLQGLNDNPHDQQALEMVRAVGEGTLSAGVSGIRLFNARGEQLLTVGTMVRKTAEMAVPLPVAHGKAQLQWQDGFVLWSEHEVLLGGRLVGKYIAEQRLSALTHMLKDDQDTSKSTDLLVCGRSGEEALCFPSRFYKANLRIPLYKNGQPYLAIGRAMLDQTGVMKVNDLRGVSVLASYAPIANFGLGMVLKSDTMELYQPVRERFNVLLAVLATLVLLGTWILRSQMQPVLSGIVREQKRTRNILENSHDAFIAIGTDGHITDWNTQAEHTFGWRASEAIGQNVSNLIIPPRQRAAHEAGLRRFMTTGTGPVINQRIEVMALHRNGHEIPVEMSIASMQNEVGFVAHAFLRDITERRAAQEAQAHYTAIIDGTSDAILSRSLDGTITSWNAGAEQLFGYTRQEVLGRSLELAQDAFQIEEQRLRRCIVQGELLKPYDTVWTSKDKLLVDVCVTLSPMKNQAGEIIGISHIVHNIFMRRQVERMKSEFISTVSHELRTPLTSIRGSLGLIIGGAVGEIPSKALGLLSIAASNSERLVRLVNDILDMEKLESGKFQLDMKLVEMNGLVQQAIGINQPYAQQLGVAYQLVSAPWLAYASLDADRTTQVLTNLLSNAAKFSPHDQTVAVSVLRRKGYVRVEVRDQGPGIPDEFKERIFHKFAQADASDARYLQKGTGLGLSIAKAIMEQQGGTIGFESMPGQGAMFYFELPEVMLPLPGTSVAAARGAASSTAARILICEDDADIARLLVLMMEGAGFSADIAYTAAEAHALLGQHQYVAMTLDIGLPDQDGLSFASGLRQESATRNLPIIVVSAQSPQAALDTSGLGFVNWLTKPINQQHLLQTLESVVTSTEVRKKVLHVEDDDDIALMVATLLGPDFDVTRAVSVHDAQQLLRHNRYGLAILDMRLPDGSGSQLLPLLIAGHIPVLIFSGQGNEQAGTEGVSQVLVKADTSNDQLLEVVNHLVQ